MVFLLICIFLSSLLYLIFKGFERFNIDLLQAIVVNYIVAGALGFVLAGIYGHSQTLYVILHADWIGFAVLMGAMFIIIFNLMGLSSQKAGVSATSVANKMSVVLPVMFGFLFLREDATATKITGIILALPALYFTTMRAPSGKQTNALFLPVVIFFASGVLDILLGYCSRTYVAAENTMVFTATLFTIAALLGFIYLLVRFFSGKEKIKIKNVWAGIILGIPNFGSILFVFEGLRTTGWDVSVFYPVLNMGIVVVASVLGWMCFKEKLSLMNVAGILVAVFSIYLISF